MKILFVSLGCDKNRVDSEKMLGALCDSGYSLTDDETEAEAVIVNTCCFINDAKKESIETILDLAKLKGTGKLRVLIVTGCLAERYKEDIKKELPEVDAVIGTSGQDKIAEVLKKASEGQSEIIFDDVSASLEGHRKRILTTNGSYAYLKIAEGCDKNCTYCVIPSVRGHFRSVPMDDLLYEAGDLVSGGVRELILVAEETTLYGLDIYGKKSLHLLLHRLSKIPDLKWIRILYCYPEEIYPELIHEIKTNPKICHYLDIPIQHCSDDILKRMNRRTTKAELESIIGTLRNEIPDIALRTTLISGFPGETEREHKELLAFIRKMKFDRLGVFPYSKEEGTPAAKMKNQIPLREKKRRTGELMAAQQKISGLLEKKRTGSVTDAVIEGFLPDDGVYLARTYADAPDVDGLVFVKTDNEYMTGDFLKVKITDASAYDLKGVPADEYSK